MLYTSYFGNLRNLPMNIVPIAICAKVPYWYSGLQYKVLAPKYGFFMEWKNNHDDAYYTRCFEEQVLAGLDAQQVYATLQRLGNSTDIALICYEKPQDFCHRHIVAKWFSENGISCKEWIR